MLLIMSSKTAGGTSTASVGIPAMAAFLIWTAASKARTIINYFRDSTVCDLRLTSVREHLLSILSLLLDVTGHDELDVSGTSGLFGAVQPGRTLAADRRYTRNGGINTLLF